MEKIMNVYKDKAGNWSFYKKDDNGDEHYVFDTRQFYWDRILKYQREGYTLKFYDK